MPKNSFLPAVSPEEVGIPSSALLSFIHRLEKRNIPMHSLLVIKDNQLAFEGYWAPFSKDKPHRMYSITKSFTALAIGILADQKKLSLQDTVASYFTDKLPENPHPYIMSATIEDLLKMASVHDYTTYKPPEKPLDTSDWIATYFSTPPTHLGGTIFNYDTSATTVLTALVERISEKTLVDFLREPLLDPIGCSQDMRCIQTPCGYSWGGSGLLCTSRDLARVALVCLNDGEYQGASLISKEYIRAATASQIDNRITTRRDSLGYGYQIWRIPDDGFAFIGMGSQLALCYPAKQLVVVTTADTQEFPEESNNIIRLFSELVYPQIQRSALPPSPAEEAALSELAHTLALAPLEGETSSPLMEYLNGKTFVMSENPLEFSTLGFDFSQNQSTLRYQTPRGTHELPFGLGTLVEGWFPETHYYTEQIGVPGGRAFRCTTSAVWSHKNQLTLYCYAIDDSLGLLKLNFSFDGDSVTLFGKKHAEWFFEEYQGFASGMLASAR